MKPAPIPKNEKQRLENLGQYRILDTPPEEAFDRITRIVSQTIGVPIALVSLVDQSRQWFKSRQGLDVEETSRDLAFCAHAILGDQTLVVEDASQDPRFADNPLVLSGPSIKFYAGAPLKTPKGYKLGTLCAIDRHPRKLSNGHRQLLEDLAHLVVDEMELRLALQDAMKHAAHETRLRAMQDEFVATVSHELRTPLTSIRGTLGLLEGGVAGDLPEKARDMVAIASRNSIDLLTLINDLLDMQKLNAGKLDFNFAVVEIGALLKKTCDNLQGFAAEKRVEIRHVRRDVPNVVADPLRLQQALTNLISNAVKFSPDGGAVTIKAGKRRSKIYIEVADHGPGIPEQFRQRLFDRFAQADNSGKTGGTGLGLTIAKAIAEAHNGSIDFDTAPGGGTTFRLFLPVRQTVVRGQER